MDAEKGVGGISAASLMPMTPNNSTPPGLPKTPQSHIKWGATPTYKTPSYAETAWRSDVSPHTAQALPAGAGRAAAAARGRVRWSFRMQARG